MSGFLLKNTLMRRRMATNALFIWMEENGMNPEEDCFGAPAVNAFVAKLLAQQPKGPYAFIGAKQSKLLGPQGFELHIDDLRAYLWGKDEFKVFNLNAKTDTTQDLKAQMDEAAKEQFEAPEVIALPPTEPEIAPESEPAPEPEPEPEVLAGELEEDSEEPTKKPRRRKKKSTDTDAEPEAE